MARRKRAKKKIAHKRTVTVRREVISYTYEVSCEWCGQGFEAQRSTARFCSVRCRMANHRSGQK